MRNRKSLPTRERGLKFLFSHNKCLPQSVAPYTGAWIEIIIRYLQNYLLRSLPTRERGLKYELQRDINAAG